MFNKVLIICLIAVLSACDTKPKQVDTPKIDKNDICGQWLANRWAALAGKAMYDDFIARLGATRNMDYSKRMDIALEYGFRATEVNKIEESLAMFGIGSVMIENTVIDVCDER